MGWVTPLGADLDLVKDALRAGTIAEVRPVENPETGRIHMCRPVPPKLVEHLARQPRLRRSSPISYFAIAAATAALADAGVSIGDASSRTAIVFAVSNGGVIYTRRFYEQIVKQGANAASPLLFPETVYNAPASHLAAALGLDGASYTLVGDSAIGLVALHFGAQLLATGECDCVIVVGCEEIDWILCEAFHDWHLSRTPLAEGAGALVLERAGPIRMAASAGVPWRRRSEAPGALRRALEMVPAQAELIVSGANGTFADAAESAALGAARPTVAPKKQLGEAPGASAIWQVIHGGLAIRNSEVNSALAVSVGFNQQAAASFLTRS
jgi:3-oxoacyl-(acyl-carrier-protein) synthase